MRFTTPEQLLGLARQFSDSRVLLTAAELDLFTLLSQESLTALEVSNKLEATLRGTTILLDALAAMGLLVKNEAEQYHCPPEIAALLSSNCPRSILPMIMHSAGLWKRWSALTDIVVHGKAPQAPVSFSNAADQEAFIGAMHVIGSKMAHAIVAAVQPGGAKKLLDVGGGPGTYTQAFLEAAPAMRATLFDLPAVIDMARRRLAPTGLLGRVTLVAGDFYRDELPSGHDLALLSAIIHQNSLEQNVALCRKIQNALEPGGRLVIRDHVMTQDHTQPLGGALFAVNMLVSTPGGGTYSFDEIRTLLASAGYTGIRLIQADERMSGLVEAFKP
jgi:precorrin-6B methylase 2